MKKLLAATLLIIHLFNLAGYPVLFRYLVAQSSQELAKKIDKNAYAESDLIELKVPLNMPYITPSADYERFEGEINIEDKNYNYVKRRVSNDTLYLLCLPNETKDKLTLAGVDYGKNVNDFDADEKKDNAIKKLNILNQYHKVIHEYFFAVPCNILSKNNPQILSLIPDSFIAKHDRPPQLNS